MARELIVDGFTINDESDCYIIAEIGHNHQGDLDKAKQLFHSAKECGVNAVKLQKRDNPTLFTKEMFASSYDNRNSYGGTFGTHREALEFGREEYEELFRYCGELGVTFFSTAFDFVSADFLEDLNAPAYKIASGDLKNTPLLKYVAQFQKPMFVSTGGGSMEDVVRAYETVMPINPNLCLMQCTAGYPAEFEELNLRVIETYRERFPDNVIGLSSHDNGIAMALVAYVIGARVIEKHFTLNRSLKGSDHAFSMEGNGMRRVVRDIKRARVALGDGLKRKYESEESPLYKMSKKLVASRSLPGGHVLQEGDVCLKSPGDGLPPYELENLIGKEIVRPIDEDENIMFEDVREA